MKRTATRELADAPVPKKGRTAALAVLPGTDTEESLPKLEPNDDLSDTESHYTEVTSAIPADTPLTPLSPARKWPSDLKTIRCSYPDCNKTFNRPARLAAHLRSHNNERPFVCPYPDCDKNYIEEKHLKQHIKGSHTAERDHVCTHEGCGKKFMTATRLRRHQLVHEGQERFQCRDFPPCNQSFRKHQTLQRHIRTEHQHQPAFQCNHRVDESGSICGQGFDTAGALRRHQERDHGENKFWCEECAAQTDDMGNPRAMGFPTLALLQTHMKTSHIKCMFCGESCNGREDLESHVELVHANQKTVEERKTIACTWSGCNKTFTRTSNLNVHIRSAHEGSRSFVCGEFDLSQVEDLVTWSNSQGCGQAFSLKAALEKHVRYVHLMHDRPPPIPAIPTGVLLLPHENASNNTTTILEQLTGINEKQRRTLPCTFSGCHMKFTYSGELEDHIQKEHQIEQALLDGLEDFGKNPDPSSSTLQDVAQGISEWEAEYGGEDFWVGADMANPMFNNVHHGAGVDDEEWLRDEAEMRKLIGDDSLSGLIDPSLGR